MRGGFVQDVRYALRLVGRNPGFSAVALLTLGLGIGANTAMFSVINAVFLRPLPYPEPQRLVQFNHEVDGPFWGSRQTGASYRFLRDHLESYEHVASRMERGDLTLVQNGRPEPLAASAITPAYFDALGVRPARGRSFTATEADAGGPDAAILSHRAWQRLFSGDPAIVGRVVSLDGKSHEVVGVMPEAFRHRPETDVWVPLRPGPHDGGTNRFVVARLRAGITPGRAQGELDRLKPAWVAAIGSPSSPRVGLHVRSFQSDAADNENLTRPLMVLMLTVAFVLLIACANLANLLLARATTRVREIAIRATLGASRARLIRQLVAESLVLSLLGGGFGLLLAHWTMPALLALSPVSRDAWGEIGLDRTVLAFALLLSVATGLLFGLVPALQATRADLTSSAKEGGRTSAGRRTGLLRQTLIVGEVAVSVALLIGALLLVRTFLNLTAVAPGFDAERLTVGRMAISTARYDTADKLARYYRTVLGELRRMAGVESAAVVLNAPMGEGLNVPFAVRTSSAQSEGSDSGSVTDWRYITPGYFETLRTPLLVGRAFTTSDSAAAPRVAIVNQQFVRMFLRDRQPIGQRLTLFPRWKSGDVEVEIVGVVGDVKQRSLAERAPEIVYVPIEQTPDATLRLAHGWFPVNWVVRGGGAGGRGGLTEGALAQAMQREALAVDPQQPFTTIRTMNDLIERSLTAQRFHMLLSGGCALLAVVLAAAGLFGVISYAVAQRGHEMGVRLALGATTAQLVASVVREGALLAAMGVGLGLVAALGLTRLLASFVFGVSPTDPATFAAAGATLLALATLASLVPALRLLRLDPAAVLRRG